MGAVAAVISFILGVGQLVELVQRYRLHHGAFAEAMSAGTVQLQREDYPAAYASYEQAVKLDPNDQDAQRKQLRAAMLWLENIHGSNPTFTEVADKLLPVLDAGIARSKGPDAADLVAHEGWADFLKMREGAADESSIDPSLKRSLSIDPANVYGHAMTGFWILWQGGKLEDAKQHFNAAFATGREKDYVRTLQLAALENSSRDETDAEMIRVADAMRKGGESISDRDRGRILSVYSTYDRKRLEAMLSLLPPTAAKATYDWLAQGRDEKWQQNERAFIEAYITEIGGDRAGALASFQALRKNLPKTSTLLDGVDESIRRLSH